MQALERLSREHRAIGGLLDRLEAEIDAFGRCAEMDVEAVARLLAFFDERVDGQHQEEEERAFLPRLAERASPADEELVRAALVDHAAERRLLALARSNVEGAAFGEPTCTAVVARNARRYVLLQRRHARWEEHVLFSLARRTLSSQDDRDIRGAIEHSDRTRGGSVLDAARSLEEWLDQRRSLVTA